MTDKEREAFDLGWKHAMKQQTQEKQMSTREIFANFLRDADKEREAFDLGWKHGEYNAINAAFGRKTGLYGYFDTPDEEEAYYRGYQMGWNSVD